MQAVPVLFVIYAITFFMIRLAPGSPFSSERKVPAHVLEAQMAYYGYSEPLHVQFFNTLARHVTLDLPPLTSHPGLTSADIIAQAFPVSLELGLYAMLIALTLGVPAGIVAAARRNTPFDYVPMSISMVGICIPTFVVGPLLVLVFGIWLQLTNVTGWSSLADKTLPSLTLGFYYAAYVARITRGGMLETLSADYVRTARAKGASDFRAVMVHALRGGILPLISFLGPTLAGLVTGSFVVETIFQVPGLGRHFVLAAINRDLSLILSTTLFYAALIIFANLVVDTAQVLLNPKLRFS